MVGKPKGLGEADAGRHAHFCRIGTVSGLELEVSLKAYVKDLTSMEYVLVIVTELRGNAKQPGGVHRCLQ